MVQSSVPAMFTYSYILLHIVTYFLLYIVIFWYILYIITATILQQNRLRWYEHVLQKEDNDWVKIYTEYEVGMPCQQVDQRKLGDCVKRLSDT